MSNELIKRLHAQHVENETALRALLDTATTRSEKAGDLSTEERQKYDALFLEADERSRYDAIEKADSELRAELDRLVKSEESRKAFESRAAELGLDKPVPGREDRATGVKVLADQFRQLLDPENVTRRSINVDIDARTMQRAFDTRALTTTSAANSIADPEWSTEFLRNLIDRTHFLNVGPTVQVTTHGRDIKFRFDGTEGTAAWVGATEATAIAGTDPTWASPVTWSAFKAGQLVRVSNETIEDADWAFLQYIASQAGFAIGNLTDAAYFNGDGTNKPTGAIPSATAVSGNIANLAALGFDKLIDAQHALGRPYRPNAKWAVADAAVQTLRKIKDTTNQYIWQPAVTMGAPDLLLNKPVIVDPQVPVSGTNSRVAVYGDWSRYRIRQVNQVRFERSDDRYFDTDEAAFRTIIRVDGKLETASALVAIVATA